MNASLTRPMSSNSPSRWYWPHWLSLYWNGTNSLAWVAARSELMNRVLSKSFLVTGEKLVRLSFINFARWSVVRRVPANAAHGDVEKFPYGYVLFETNYNGDQDLYFEAFSMVTPVAMMLTWQRCYDVPWIPGTGRFIDFINDKELEIDCSYCAYPGATTKVIRSALALKGEVKDFQESAPSDPVAFQREYKALLTRVQTLADPRTPVPRGLKRIWRKVDGKETGLISVLTPVKPCCKDQLKKELSDLEQLMRSHDDASRLFPDCTHSARWVPIDRLDVPRRRASKPRPETSYLLFSAWFDGTPDDFLLALYKALNEEDLGTTLWKHCGFDDTGDACHFRDYMVSHELEVGTKFSGYDGVRVQEVREALDLSQRFFDFAVKAQRRDARDLKDRWDAEFG